mmetsp:Transcript_115861/g.368374  ORF Transcript_115861/g.368374 Transcript_115861/m.368374 type:complete len:262 (+) Transcript_115861:46-831(+)
MLCGSRHLQLTETARECAHCVHGIRRSMPPAHPQVAPQLRITSASTSCSKTSSNVADRRCCRGAPKASELGPTLLHVQRGRRPKRRHIRRRRRRCQGRHRRRPRRRCGWRCPAGRLRRGSCRRRRRAWGEVGRRGSGGGPAELAREGIEIPRTHRAAEDVPAIRCETPVEGVVDPGAVDALNLLVRRLVCAHQVSVIHAQPDGEPHEQRAIDRQRRRQRLLAQRLHECSSRVHPLLRPDLTAEHTYLCHSRGQRQRVEGSG